MSESEATATAVQSPKSRPYPKDFQQNAVCLVTDEKYTFKAAALAVGVSQKSLRNWHKKHAPPPVPSEVDPNYWTTGGPILDRRNRLL